MSWLREVFSDGGQGSASRVMLFLHSMAAIGWGSHFVYHTHTIPDVTTLGGLAAFAVAPYAANKTAEAISSFGNAGPK